MSRRTTVFGNSMSLAFGPFPQDEDPSPRKVARTFFTSFPLPGLAGNSAFLFETPCTWTSTRGSCKLGTSMLLAAFALVAFSLRRV
ncbi:hypothetical protein DEO72_LG3g1376 [Vigna unguiculata]|uniref:Uncharacterized protein n=1 Tax=Vigna unguiculata TaxID=3917 RepID=A0A4D6LEB0_VIGUN|nr:hypothetical protein DEO72_LG3g1376 [Vigna unguiculata]